MSTNRRPVLALVWILLASAILSIPNYTSDKHLPNALDESKILETSSIPESEKAIIVEDHDGVDAVTMMYSQKEGDSENISMSTQDTGVWQNVTMSQGLDGWYETTIPVSNISEPYSWCSYLVKYVANDTLGNWEVSPLCIYVFTQTIVTADWFSIDLHDTPDLWYLVGTTGHTFTWSVMDIHGQSGWPYVLYEDGHLIEMWSWSGNLTISVDGLELGNHCCSSCSRNVRGNTPRSFHRQCWATDRPGQRSIGPFSPCYGYRSVSCRCYHHMVKTTNLMRCSDLSFSSALTKTIFTRSSLTRKSNSDSYAMQR
ncbi:MAG: hypothetical protein ACXABD_22100 [Candidatus Thorarchaeota archaeon]|jgi:hypothetical protein